MEVNGNLFQKFPFKKIVHLWWIPSFPNQVPSKKKKKIIKRKEFLSKKLLEKIFNSNNDPTNIS